MVRIRGVVARSGEKDLMTMRTARMAMGSDSAGCTNRMSILIVTTAVAIIGANHVRTIPIFVHHDTITFADVAVNAVFMMIDAGAIAGGSSVTLSQWIMWTAAIPLVGVHGGPTRDIESAAGGSIRKEREKALAILFPLSRRPQQMRSERLQVEWQLILKRLLSRV